MKQLLDLDAIISSAKRLKLKSCSY